MGFRFDCDQDGGPEDRRNLAEMVKSRMNPPADSMNARLINLRLPHDPQDREVVKQSFLVKHLGEVHGTNLDLVYL